MGVALGHVAGALLVAHEDVADRRVEDRVVDGQDAAAGQAEHDLDPLHLEALDEGLGSGELHGVLRSGRPGEDGWDGDGPAGNRAEKAIDLPGWEVEERTRLVEPVRYWMSTRAQRWRRISGQCARARGIDTTPLFGPVVRRRVGGGSAGRSPADRRSPAKGDLSALTSPRSGHTSPHAAATRRRARPGWPTIRPGAGRGTAGPRPARRCPAG